MEKNTGRDCIVMKDICCYGYHGVLEEENQLGQKFYIDVKLELSLKEAGKTDDLSHTINYALAYEIIRIQCEEKKYRLIEALAEQIARDLFHAFKRLEEIEIEVRKPGAPVRGNFAHMAVRIHRSRGDYEQMNRVYLSMGSNMGDKKKYLEEALRKIENTDQIRLVKISKFYETPPWGYEEQDCFVNLCVEIETSLEPIPLLSVLQGIEFDLKRERTIRWGPRTIDIDILLYEDRIFCDEILTIPHPRMQERAFVILPLYEINPALEINGKPIQEVLDHLDISGIKELETK